MPPLRDRGPRSPEQAAVLQESLRHMDALYRAALRMTRDPVDAEDLVQTTYLKAIRSVASYREEAGMKAWLFRILTNAYIDRYRQQRRTPETVELDEAAEPGLYDLFLEGGNQPEDAGRRIAGGWSERELDEFLRAFVGDEVKSALDELPPTFRLVLILREVEGFSYNEIAEITGVPVGTVMSRLFRARRAVQARLAAYARGHGYAAAEPPKARPERPRP
ncbi:MAG: sigma-70 family RNA polymerase sigma factor [Gemmatimonadetes bacterium]|nr:sigma-70 family RNA polymerase sigma factor [Gemmatimonadota bacterium]